MRKILFIIGITFLLATSCQESLQERAQRETREYTERNCPTPPNNGIIVDSIVYNPKTNVYTQHLRLTGQNDNADILKRNYAQLRDGMKKTLMADAGIRAYIKEGRFDFAFVCVSDSSRKVILELKYKNKELI